jgi:hypothetical protein
MNTVSSTSAEQISTLIDAELRTPVSRGSMAMTDALKARYGDNVLGIVYYGSCFRSGTEKDGILDIFVIVDNYRSVYPKRTLAITNKLLPPNVFYYEMDFEGHTLRTKYAVITLDQFVHRTSMRCFHTFFWARFAQPCALTFVRDETIRATIVAAINQAIGAFITRVLPLLPPRFDTEMLWRLGLSASYRTELRPESPDAAARLVAQNLERYRAVTTLTLALRADIRNCSDGSDPHEFIAVISARERWISRQLWRIRRPQGKIINLLRILKAAFTFDGGVDYVLWKIERHSGVKVEATPMLRRHPLLTCWRTVWRLYRAGAFR